MRTFFCLSFLVVFIIFAGCSDTKKPAGLPALHPCEVTITQDGKPLAGANVVFYGDQTWAIGGGTDESGIAKIYTHGTFAGAPAGTYKVTITKTVTEGGPTEAERNDPSFSGGGGSTYDLVNPKFRSAGTTSLEVEVQSGKNTKTLDVEKSVKVLQPKV